jgi:hypothetical protein
MRLADKNEIKEIGTRLVVINEMKLIGTGSKYYLVCMIGLARPA